jgi:hypothetical protein
VIVGHWVYEPALRRESKEFGIRCDNCGRDFAVTKPSTWRVISDAVVAGWSVLNSLVDHARVDRPPHLCPPCAPLFQGRE